MTGPPERGSATVYAIGIMFFLCVVAFGLLQVSFVLGLRQQAAQAADLAALAATRASVEGEDACAVAANIAIANGAKLKDCELHADVATVRVRATTTRWVIGGWAAEDRARAAPTWYLE